MNSAFFPRRLVLSALIASLSLSGCASFQQVERHNADAQNAVAQGMQQIQTAQPSSPVRVEAGPFLVGAAVPVSNDPAVLSQRVVLATAQPITLGQAAMFISQQTGVPVSVSSAILERQNKGASVTRPQLMSLPGLPGQPSTALNLAAPSSVLPGVGQDDGKVTLNYSGTLRGLLDALAAQTHTYWKYDKDTVRFFLTETRVFQINALPGKTGMSSSISNAGNGGSVASGGSSGSGPSQTGNSAQSASLDVTLDPYKSIEDAVKTVLKQSGADAAAISSVTVDPSSGQLIVTATPPELDAVGEYVKTINAQMAKNVLIDVKVYSVSLNNSADLSLSLNAALSSLVGGGVGSLNLGSSLGATATNNLSAGILSGAISGNALLSALQKIGTTSLVTSGSVIALNGQPSPLQVSNSAGYLAAVTQTNTANVGSSTALTPGSVISGFSGTFLPLVRGNHILLEYALSLSQNLGFLTASSGGSQIQVPNTALQTTSNRVSLKSGDTIVLAGFEQTGGSATSGDGLSSFNRGASNSRTALVITMHVVNLGD
jgi:type IVB pilus formation R64 PilN family outer membrane protein